MTFRFDAKKHQYYNENGRPIKHITGLLIDEGLIDDAFFTAAGRDRGHAVHKITADWDLGVLEPELIEGSPYLGYLGAYQAMSAILQPTWTGVEIARVHSSLRYGGRPDRDGMTDGRPTVLEIKSGAPHKSTGIQLAMQSILLEDETGLAAKRWRRMTAYLKPTGNFRLYDYPGAYEIEEAHRIIRKHCR